MGFAGVMMIATVYFLYKFVACLVKMIRWKTVGHAATGTIGEPQSVMKSSDPNAPSNNYDLHIEYEGGTSDTWYHIDQARYIAPGTQFALLFNPTNKDYVLVSELKSGLVGYLVAFLGSFTMVVAAYLIWQGVQ